MKKNIIFLFAVSFVVLFGLIVAAVQTSKRYPGNTAPVATLDGAWQRVYRFDGKTVTTGEPKEFIVVHNGFFASIGQDSEGHWTNTHGGSFEISGNLMKNHLLYSSHADRVGFTAWCEFELKKDTLIMKWNITKMITPQGQEITVEMPTTESKFVRAKR